jgi:hypothetical protein
VTGVVVPVVKAGGILLLVTPQDGSVRHECWTRRCVWHSMSLTVSMSIEQITFACKFAVMMACLPWLSCKLTQT